MIEILPKDSLQYVSSRISLAMFSVELLDVITRDMDLLAMPIH